MSDDVRQGASARMMYTEVSDAIADALMPLAERHEATGLEYRDWLVPLLQAFEVQVGVAIAAVEDPTIRAGLVARFSSALEAQVNFHARLHDQASGQLH